MVSFPLAIWNLAGAGDLISNIQIEIWPAANEQVQPQLPAEDRRGRQISFADDKMSYADGLGGVNGCETESAVSSGFSTNQRGPLQDPALIYDRRHSQPSRMGRGPLASPAAPILTYCTVPYIVPYHRYGVLYHTIWYSSAAFRMRESAAYVGCGMWYVVCVWGMWYYVVCTTRDRLCLATRAKATTVSGTAAEWPCATEHRSFVLYGISYFRSPSLHLTDAIAGNCAEVARTGKVPAAPAPACTSLCLPPPAPSSCFPPPALSCSPPPAPSCSLLPHRLSFWVALGWATA